MKLVERKSDHIKVIDSTSVSKPIGFRCINCQERHYLVALTGDHNNYFCTYCGEKTPIRTLKRERGVVAPTIQQAPAIVQKQNSEGREPRKPHAINEKKNPLEESLILQGKQVIDSQWNEPTA